MNTGIIDFINTIDHPECMSLNRFSQIHDGRVLTHLFNELVRVLKINIKLDPCDKDRFGSIYNGLQIILKNTKRLDKIYKIENRVGLDYIG